MLVEIFRLPSGWQQFDVSDVESIGDAAYWVVRSTHSFLTDDNHSYEAERLHEIEWGDKKIQWRQVSIYRKHSKARYESDYWFGVKYREVQS